MWQLFMTKLNRLVKVDEKQRVNNLKFRNHEN